MEQTRLLRVGVRIGALATMGLAGLAARSQTARTPAAPAPSHRPDPTVENAKDLVKRGR